MEGCISARAALTFAVSLMVLSLAQSESIGKCFLAYLQLHLASEFCKLGLSLH